MLSSHAHLEDSEGFEAHQQVTVQGEAGSLEQIELIPGLIRQGCGLMFFPEANVLMRGVSDQTCGTPAFKRVPVLIRAQVRIGQK